MVSFPFDSEDKKKIEEKISEIKKRKKDRLDLLPSKTGILKKKELENQKDKKNIIIAKKIKDTIIEKKGIHKNKKDITEKIAKTHRELFPDVDINIEKQLTTTPTSSPAIDIELENFHAEDQKVKEKKIPPIKNNNYIKKKGLTDKLTEIDTEMVKEYVEKEIEVKSIFLSRFMSGLFDITLVGIITYLFYYLASILTGGTILDKNFLNFYPILFFTLFTLYSTTFLFTTGQTVGMLIGGTKLKSEEKLSILKILLRELFFFFSITFLGIGLIWGFFNKRGQCWHDIIIDAYVIRDK